MHVVPVIETERLVLRDWSEVDVDAYARICADPQVMRFMHPPRPLTPAEVAYDALRLREHWQRHGFGHWVVEERESGRMVGRTGIKRHDDWTLDPENTEVGWLYERAAWGKGYATEAASEVVRFCLEQLERPEVISISHPENLGSRRVMEKVGLTYAGARRWEERGMDVVWYSRRRQKPAAYWPRPSIPS